MHYGLAQTYHKSGMHILNGNSEKFQHNRAQLLSMVLESGCNSETVCDDNVDNLVQA